MQRLSYRVRVDENVEDLELGLLQSDLVMSTLGHSRELTNRHTQNETYWGLNVRIKMRSLSLNMTDSCIQCSDCCAEVLSLLPGKLR